MAEESAGPPSEAGASPLVRFVRKLSTLISLRAERGEAAGVAIFLQSDAVARDLGMHEHEEAPLLTNGNDPISGRVWLAAAGLGTAYALRLEGHDVGSKFKAVRDAGLGRLPALVVDLRGAKPVARLYTQGIESGNEEYSPVDLSDEPITPTDMKEALDHFHRKSLRTPGLVVEGHAHRVWKNARLGLPENRPEERIHGRLMESLRGRFTRHDVRAEVFTEEGRVDVQVWTPTADASGRPTMRTDWALELKALTDRTTEGKKVSNSSCHSALKEGLAQAISYRERLRALRAALCCYDMRKSDIGDTQSFKPIVSQAETQSVALWRWYLHRSAASARSTPQAVKAH